ncbi:MAG TPA: MFS transporter [Thermoanaerobaculia bacterium]|nr:MFS transporter [Thermoanaerobaculia bacterium]
MLRSLVRHYRESFSGLPRAVWLLSLAVFVNRSGTMVAPFLILWLRDERGISAGDAGLMLALYGVAGLLGSLLGGFASDRWRPRDVQAASLAATAAAFVVLVHQQHPAAIATALAVLGLVGETFRPANATSIARWATPEQRARSFALRRLAINLGMSFGPAVGGWLALHDYRYLFWADAATCLVAAALVVLVVPREAPSRGPTTAEAAAAKAAASPWRDGPFLAFLVLMIGLGAVFFQFAGTFPLTLRDLYAMPEHHIGGLIAINTLMIVLIEMPLVHGAARRRPFRMMALGSVLVGLGVAMLPYGSTFAFAAFTVVVWTWGEMLAFPIAESAAAERASAEVTGAYLGLFTTAFSVAFVLAQLTGPWIYDQWGAEVLWVGCGLVCLLVAAGFLFQDPERRRSSVARES